MSKSMLVVNGLCDSSRGPFCLALAVRSFPCQFAPLVTDVMTHAMLLGTRARNSHIKTRSTAPREILPRLKSFDWSLSDARTTSL